MAGSLPPLDKPKDCSIATHKFILDLTNPDKDKRPDLDSVLIYFEYLSKLQENSPVDSFKQQQQQQQQQQQPKNPNDYAPLQTINPTTKNVKTNDYSTLQTMETSTQTQTTKQKGNQQKQGEYAPLQSLEENENETTNSENKKPTFTEIDYDEEKEMDDDEEMESEELLISKKEEITEVVPLND